MENKVAPKDRQRLANVIACKNVIKDQSLPVKRLLRVRHIESVREKRFLLESAVRFNLLCAGKETSIPFHLSLSPIGDFESFN